MKVTIAPDPTDDRYLILALDDDGSCQAPAASLDELAEVRDAIDAYLREKA